MKKNLNIALLGYGKMGKMIETLAEEQHIKIDAVFDEFNPLKNDKKTREMLQNTDVLIDFSVPSAVIENVKLAADMKKNLVIGTTGWLDREQVVRDLVKSGGIGVIYGSNFSLGVNLFFRVSEYAARLFSAFQNYDPYIEEAHHKMKKDAPSGTALVIKKLISKSYPGVDIPVSSVRSGYIPGTHSVNFDSIVDSVRLEHIARGRVGFAEGAILAAKWLKDKTGFYEFPDVLDSILGSVE
ncbi:MAG: 4-hydroxy-tetrahydrodipicolinate reductase [Calditrichaceae bacterium]